MSIVAILGKRHLQGFKGILALLISLASHINSQKKTIGQVKVAKFSGEKIATRKRAGQEARCQSKGAIQCQ